MRETSAPSASGRAPFFAGWLGALAPASDAIDGITGIGFVGFFVWMAAMGVSLLLGERAAASKTPPPASA